MGAVHVRRRAVGLKRVHTDLARSVQVVSRLRKERWYMASRTFSLSIEDVLAALRRGCVEATLGWLRSGDRQLIEMQGAELRRDQVRRETHIERAVFYGERILCRIAESGIKKCAGTPHFRNANVGVPVRYGPKASPGMQVDPRQPKRRRNQGAGPFPIRAQSLSILSQFCIKATRAPAR